MKLKMLLGLLLAALIMGTSCDDEKNDGIQTPRYYEYFIGTYCSMDLALEPGYVDEQGKMCLVRLTRGENNVRFNSPDYSNPNHVTQFLKIAKRNGDDFKGTDYPLFWYERMALSDNLVSIHITSDSDWDASHPAGTPLDEQFEINLNSFTEYLRNGYAFSDTSSVNPDPIISGARNIVKKVSELTADELAIIQYNPVFTVLSSPTLAEEHTLTFTLTNTDGKEYYLTTTFKPTAYVP